MQNRECPATTAIGTRTQPSQFRASMRSEEHTSQLQSPDHLVCRLLLEKKKKNRQKESPGALAGSHWKAIDHCSSRTPAQPDAACIRSSACNCTVKASPSVPSRRALNPS